MTEISDWEARAREAGWLPPDEVKLKTWRAFNLLTGNCRWCGAKRAWPDRKPQPHRPQCRFYDGPVTHGPSGGHFGTFGYWISCACGRNYTQQDAAGYPQECPDKELTWRHPQEPDLSLFDLGAAS